MDRKKKLPQNFVNGLLVFTSISAIIFLSYGISLLVSLHKYGALDEKHVIKYSDCKPIQANFDTCKDYVEKTESSLCRCKLKVNITQSLSKFDIYALLEATEVNTESNEDQLLENCDPNTEDRSKSNSSCSSSLDLLFNDTIQLKKNDAEEKLVPTSGNKNVATLRKTGLWKSEILNYNSDNPDENTVIQRRQIKVWLKIQWDNSTPEAMDSKNSLSEGHYLLKIMYLGEGEYNGPRKLIFSSLEPHVEYNSPCEVNFGITIFLIGIVMFIFSSILLLFRNRWTIVYHT